MKTYRSSFRIGKLYSLIIALLFFSCEYAPDSWSLTSPDGKIKATLQMQEGGQLTYQVLVNDGADRAEIIEPSPLGIIRTDQTFDSLKFIAAEEVKKVDEEYKLATGKRLHNRNYYQELTVHFENRQGSGLDVVFRAYNDGVAFKYVFPEDDDSVYTVIRELTGFDLPEGLAWMQPYDSATAYAPAYERNYEGAMPIGTAAPFDD